MKLTTIVREGQDRAAVVLDLPVGWDGGAGARPEAEGGSDPNPPPAGYDRYYLDVARARDLLTASQSRLRWPAGLTFPETPALGREGQLLPLRLLLAGGPATLAVLGDLVETVRLLAQRGDGILAAPALVPADAARLRTPVPDAPLCYILHGNAVVVWRRQVGIDPNQHIMTRIPAMRIRTVNALLGHDEPLYLPAGAQLSFGNELGFVIGQEARNVPAEHAYRHVAGYVCTNDGYSNVYSLLAPDAPTRISSTLQIGDKATDGCGPVGPWIATAEEVGDPHDLMLLTRQDGLLRNRSHSGAYIVGVEEAVERLSHRFPLLPGTIVTLGAAGWDGISDEPVNPASGRSVLEVEAERIGVLRTPLIYPDADEQAAREGGSPYLFTGTVDGTTPLDRWESDDDSPTALAGLPPPRGFWTLFGNQREARAAGDRGDGLPGGAGGGGISDHGVASAAGRSGRRWRAGQHGGAAGGRRDPRHLSPGLWSSGQNRRMRSRRSRRRSGWPVTRPCFPSTTRARWSGWCCPRRTTSGALRRSSAIAAPGTTRWRQRWRWADLGAPADGGRSVGGAARR